MTDLLVAPCSAKASRYAVMHWHYSKTMPIGRLIRFGVWEDGRFVGSVIYGRGATPQMAKHHKLKQTEFCELVRIALDEHETTVSKIVSETLRQLRETNPGIRLVASFADPNEGHHGGIYQAGNWIYIGRSGEAEQVYFQGRWQHPRNANPSTFGGKTAYSGLSKLTPAQRDALPRRRVPGKHRYVYPLDRGMRRRMLAQSKPYPARGEVLNGSDVPSRDVGRVRSPGTAPTEATS